MGANNAEFWNQHFIRSTGVPYSGIRVFHYDAGTLVARTVWIDGDKATPAAQPVVGDAQGRVTFYAEGTYRFIVRTSIADGDLILYDWDKVEMWHTTATLRTENQGTSLPGAVAATRGRLFATVDGGGDVIDVSVQETAAAWQSFLFANSDPGGTVQWSKGADLASSNTLTLGADGNYFDVTGTNTIATISTKGAGTPILLQFDAILTLTHSASLSLKDDRDYKTAAGDHMLIVSEGGGNWREALRMPAVGGFDEHSHQ